MKSLIIEDDRSNRLLMERILGAYGPVEAVESAEEALERILPLGLEPYDLVVIDLVLPGRDGFSVAQAIREAEKEAQILPHWRVKLMVVTALNSNEAVLKAYQSGVDLFLRKPVEVGQVRGLLSELGFRLEG